jgi:hypothetical protein
MRRSQTTPACRNKKQLKQLTRDAVLAFRLDDEMAVKQREADAAMLNLPTRGKLGAVSACKHPRPVNGRGMPYFFASSACTSFSSTVPVAAKPLSFWKAAIAVLVLAPMTPSAPPAS